MSAAPLLAAIARQHLSLATLDTRNADRLDFSDQAVWNIRAALEAAYAAGAAATATAAQDTEEGLVAEYAVWTRAQALPYESADDLIQRRGLTDHQRAWLGAYLARWDAMQSREVAP